MTLREVFDAARVEIEKYDRGVKHVTDYCQHFPLAQQQRLIGERPAWADYLLQLEADDKLVQHPLSYMTIANDVEANALAVRCLEAGEAYLAARVQPDEPRPAA